jgi:hypothetical protein
LSKLRENLMNSSSGRPGAGCSYSTVSSSFFPVPPPSNSAQSTMRVTLLSADRAPEARKARVRKSVPPERSARASAGTWRPKVSPGAHRSLSEAACSLLVSVQPSFVCVANFLGPGRTSTPREPDRS